MLSDFFTRHVHDSARPVASPDDDSVIANACESRPYNIERDIKLHDKFFIKGQPYSVLHMLAHDPTAKYFAGGTVYQAFLSALSYHRWHAPVNGTIEKIALIPGTYYAAVEGTAANGGGGALVNSQSFLTAVATRAIFYIKTAEPDIGLVVFMAVGMCEVSTCHVTAREGQEITKGDQLGMFHFGGSSFCLIFNRDTEVTWTNGIVDEEGQYVADTLIKVNAEIATAKKRVVPSD